VSEGDRVLLILLASPSIAGDGSRSEKQVSNESGMSGGISGSIMTIMSLKGEISLKRKGKGPS